MCTFMSNSCFVQMTRNLEVMKAKIHDKELGKRHERVLLQWIERYILHYCSLNDLSRRILLIIMWIGLSYGYLSVSLYSQYIIRIQFGCWTHWFNQSITCEFAECLIHYHGILCCIVFDQMIQYSCRAVAVDSCCWTLLVSEC